MSFHHGKAALGSEIENKFRDIFRRRIGIDEVQWFAQLFEDRYGGIVTAQNHAVIQRFVNPLAYDLFDVGEIQDHAAGIQLRRFQYDDCSTIMPMQITALAVVIQQAMAITEINFACDTEHDWVPGGWVSKCLVFESKLSDKQAGTLAT
jgi:hypothetical protein